MRNPDYSDEMDVENAQWSVKLKRLRDEVLESRSISKAISILEELLKAKESIDEGNWLDVRDLLVIIFEMVPIQTFLDQYQIVLLSVINHSPDRVVDLVARHYFEPNMPKITAVLKNSALAITVALARRLPGEECYDALSKILWQYIEVNEVMKEFEEQLKNVDSQFRFHVHHVTSLALKNKPANHKPGLTLLVNAIIKDIKTKDLLISLSALELLCDATSDHIENAKFFQCLGLAALIYEMMQNLKAEPEGGFLYPVCVRFFAHMSVVDPMALTKYPKFVDSVLDMVYHFDLLDAPQRALAFETLAVVSSTSNAKKILNGYKEYYNMEKSMNHFGAACASGPTELRSRHVEALGLMMSKFSSSEDSDILKLWFHHLGDPFPDLILDYVKKPFADLRMAALSLLAALMEFEWARQIFSRTSGFVEYLLNRNVDISVDGNQLKFDIICKIIDSNSSAITPSDLASLKRYKKQGVFYKEYVPELAVDNN